MQHTADAVDQANDVVRTGSLRRWAFIIGVGIFATTLSQPEVIDLPLRNLLKDNLQLSRPEMAAFFALGGLPWYFKAAAGLLSDSFPLFGTRRRHYLIVSAVLATVLWLVLGQVPRAYLPLLLAIGATNTMLVVGSTVLGGLLVEAEQRLKAGGRLVSARVFVDGVCVVVAGPLAGLLAGFPFAAATLAGGAIAFTLVPIAVFMLHEPATARYNVSTLSDAYGELRGLFHSATVWIAAAFLLIVSIPQELATVIYYYQRDDLKFSVDVIGWLKSVSGGGAVLAAIAYGYVSPRVALRPLLVVGIIGTAVGQLIYVSYQSLPAAVAIELAHGFLTTFGGLVLMELAVWATPKGAAAMGFAIFMSALNGGDAIGDVLAAEIAERWSLGIAGLAVISAAGTAAMLAGVPLLPRTLFADRDHDRVAA